MGNKPTCLVPSWNWTKEIDLDSLRGFVYNRRDGTGLALYWLPFDKTPLRNLRMEDFESSVAVEEEHLET